MAAPIIKGNQLSSLEQLSGSPEVDRIADVEVSRTYRYACQWDGVASAIASIPSICDDNGALRLQAVGYVRDGITAIVTARYSADGVNGNSSIPNAGINSDPVRDGDSNASEIPVEQHPDFSYRNGDGEAVVAGIPLPGVESYLFPQPTYSYTFWAEIAAAQWTEALLIKNVGKLIAPAGLTSPTAGKWLKTGRKVRAVGKTDTTKYLVEITEQYQYDSAGWESVLYANGAGTEGAI